MTENKAWGQGTGDTGGEGSGLETPSPIDVTPSEQGTEGIPENQGTPEVTWVSLTEANTSTGVSKSALRKWYRNGTIKSQTVEGKYGPEKRVILEEVQELAARREITAPEPTPADDTREEEAPLVTLKLVESLMVLSDKHAEAEARASVAEQKVEHLESQLKEQRAVSEEKVENLESQLQELQAPSAASAQEESQKPGPRRIGAWWRNRFGWGSGP